MTNHQQRRCLTPFGGSVPVWSRFPNQPVPDLVSILEALPPGNYTIDAIVEQAVFNGLVRGPSPQVIEINKNLLTAQFQAVLADHSDQTFAASNSTWLAMVDASRLKEPRAHYWREAGHSASRPFSGA